MISPNSEIRHFCHIDPCFISELCLCTILIESSHGEPAIGRDIFRIVHGDETVGIAGIPNHEHANIAGCILLNRFALANENFTVDAEKIFAFHPRFAWHAPHQ